GIRIDGGDLLLSTSAGELRQHAPTAYQEIGGIRTEIASKYEIKGKGKRVVSFRLGTYDHRAPLVIDPTVVYSTYFGGNGYSPVGLAVDASGNAYITGNADTATFTSTPGALSQGAGVQGFVSKVDSTGTNLIYSALFGGDHGAGGEGIAVDGTGNAFVTG